MDDHSGARKMTHSEYAEGRNDGMAVGLLYGFAIGVAVAIGATLFIESARAQPAPNDEFVLRLNVDDIRKIDAGLGELPKRIADPIVAKLQAQISAQIKEREDKAAAEEKARAKPN